MLRSMFFKDAEVDVIEQDGDATALLSLLEGRSRAYLVDACMSGAPCGSIQRFDAADSALPCDVFDISTHGFGLYQAIELGRALRQLPRQCVVYAIEGESFETGASMTAPMEAAVVDVCRRILDEISPAGATETVV